MKEKEVIFVLHTLSVGGAERHIRGIANYFARNGVSVQILLLDDARVSFTVDPRISIVCLNQAIREIPEENLSDCRLFPMPAAARWIHKAGTKWRSMRINRLRRRKADFSLLKTEDYLRTHYVKPLIEYLKKHPKATVIPSVSVPNIVTMMAAQRLSNRVIFCEFTSPEHEFPKDSPFNILKNRYYPRADAAIFQTPDARDYYTNLPNTQKKLIPNFIEGEQLPPRFEGKRRREIVSFCRLHPVKNLPLLIDAFALLLREYPDFMLRIYGEGELRESLIRYIEEKGLSNAVCIHEFDIHLHEKIRDAALFVSSSDREGISNAMLEALAIGLPTVCTDCPAGGARLMIKPYENGLLVPVGDVRALYEAMKEVLDNPELSDRMSRHAVGIKEKLTIDWVGQQWLALV